MRRATRLSLLLVVVLLTAALATMPARAQGGPSQDAFNRIFADLSQRTGKTIDPKRVDGTWTFGELVVTGDNLGCPVPGSNAPGQTRAWQVNVTLNGLGTYDYRVSKDERVLFLCAGTGVGAPPPGQPAGPAAAPTPQVIAPLPPQQTAPVNYPAPVYAFVGADGNVYLNTMTGQVNPTAITGDAKGRYENSAYLRVDKNYGSLSWSPDGSKLAFMDFFNGTLYVVESGQAPRIVAQGIQGIFPPAWSPDGTEIAYAMFTGQEAPSSPMDSIYQIQAVSASGGNPRVVGQITYSVGCGGGGYSPSLSLYFTEAGYGGHAQILQWTSAGFVHTMNCIGIGLALSGFDGRRIWEQPNIGRIVISPDGRRAAGVQAQMATRDTGSLLVVSLADGGTQPIMTSGLPHQVGWSGDNNSILYSSRILREQVPGNPASVVGQQVMPAWPQDAQNYDLTVWSIPTAGGQSTQLYATQGYAIGLLVASPNYAVALLSIVQSEVAMMKAVNANQSASAVLALVPQARMAVIALTPGAAGYPFEVAVPGGRPSISRIGQFTAMPAAVQSSAPVVGGTTGDNPLGLVIGGRAIVPEGGSVNMRTEPTLQKGNNVIRLIKPGEYVTILNGPRLAEGLRWWEVRREADGQVGWVVDQFVNGQGKVENNLVAVR